MRSRALRRQFHADVERHRNIDSESFLKCDHVLRRELMRAAVEMRAEAHAIVGELAPRFE